MKLPLSFENTLRRKLNANATFGKSFERVSSISCTFNLRPMSKWLVNFLNMFKFNKKTADVSRSPANVYKSNYLQDSSSHHPGVPQMFIRATIYKILQAINYCCKASCCVVIGVLETSLNRTTLVPRFWCLFWSL